MINPFRKRYTAEELKFFRFLSRNKLFEKLSYKEMLHFIPFLHIRKYKKNEIIFFRNDPSQALYLVKSGRITLNIDINDRFENLQTLEYANSFGDNALLRETKRIYTAVTESESAELYVMPQVNILTIFNERPEVKAKMLESLSELYNEYTEKLFKTYKSAQGFFNLNYIYENV